MPATISGRVLKVAADSGRVVAVEEEPLAGERCDERDDVALLAGLPVDELLLQGHRGDEAAGAATPFDASRRRSSSRFCSRYMATACDASWMRDRVTLPVGVLPVVGRAVVLEVLRLERVGVHDGVASVSNRDDERLVDDVLDRRSRRIRRHQRAASRPRRASASASPCRGSPGTCGCALRGTDSRPCRCGRCGRAAAAPRRAPAACSWPSSRGCGTSAAASASSSAPGAPCD